MQALNTFLTQHACGGLLPLSAQLAAAVTFSCTLGEVEQTALEQGLLPARYQRNRETISVKGQLTLYCSRVAVIGCGGLGGYVIEQLARLGVGQIVAIDPDVFEEHNLNRQLLATTRNLGKPKVEAAGERVAEINPAVTLIGLHRALCRDNGHHLLRQSNVVIDALDSIPVRLELARICAELDIPLVHGAIGGWYGQVTTQFPGDGSLEKIYQGWIEGKGVEKELGNPSFTPAVAASLQVAEACKVLLEEGRALRGRMLSLDLQTMEFHQIDLR